MSYSYATAKAILTEGEKDRILALYLSTDEPNVDWDKATQAFGAASVQSMRVSVRNALAKVAQAGGKNGVTAPSAVGNGPAPKPSRPALGKLGRPPKRKAEGAGSDNDDFKTPKPKRKKAPEKLVEESDDDESAENVTMKTPAKKPRKTPVKGTKKAAAAVSQEVDESSKDMIQDWVASVKQEATYSDDDMPEDAGLPAEESA